MFLSPLFPRFPTQGIPPNFPVPLLCPFVRAIVPDLTSFISHFPALTSDLMVRARPVNQQRGRGGSEAKKRFVPKLSLQFRALLNFMFSSEEKTSNVGGWSSGDVQGEGHARSAHVVRSFGCRQILEP